jgi:hypothetical protein
MPKAIGVKVMHKQRPSSVGSVGDGFEVVQGAKKVRGFGS